MEALDDFGFNKRQQKLVIQIKIEAYAPTNLAEVYQRFN